MMAYWARTANPSPSRVARTSTPSLPWVTASTRAPATTPVVEPRRQAFDEHAQPAADGVAGHGSAPQVGREGGAVLGRHLVGLRRHAVGDGAEDARHLGVHAPERLGERYGVEPRIALHHDFVAIEAIVAVDGVFEAPRRARMGAAQPEARPYQGEAAAERHGQAEGKGLRAAAAKQAPVHPHGRHIALCGQQLGAQFHRQSAEGRGRVADEMGAGDEPVGLAPLGEDAPADALGLFQQHHVPVAQGPGGGEPGDAPADDDDFVLLIGHGESPVMRRPIEGRESGKVKGRWGASDECEKLPSRAAEQCSLDTRIWKTARRSAAGLPSPRP